MTSHSAYVIPVLVSLLAASCSFRGEGVPLGSDIDSGAGPIDAPRASDGGADDIDAASAVDAPPGIDAAPGELCGDPDLVLCMEFENNAEDSSAAMNDAFAMQVNYVPGGQPGTAIAVAQGSVVYAPEDNSLDVDALTVDAWVYLEQANRDSVILHNAMQYLIRVRDDGTLNCFVAVTAGDIEDAIGGQIQRDVWTHIACTYDTSGELTAYINGVQVDVTTTPPGPILDQSNSGITIASSMGSDPWIGQLDSLRVWRRALSATEIGQIVP